MKTTLNSLSLALSLLAATGAIIGITGCSSTPHERSTGEYIDDKIIVTRVNHALGENPAYKFDDVKVASFRGTVQLSGFVNTAEQKKQAAEVARRVQDVKTVENNISVK